MARRTKAPQMRVCMCVCLNLNETGPLKVSAERAGTLSSAANGVLMIQRCFCVSGAQVPTQAPH